MSNFTRHTRSLSAAAGIATALSLFIQAPYAEACYGCNVGTDGKTSPGLACQVDIGSKGADWGYNSLGQICNQDTIDDVMVHCPLLRDLEDSKSGLSCASATLTYHKAGSQSGPPGCGLVNGDSYECIVQSKDATGYYGWWYGWAEPLSDTGGPLVLTSDPTGTVWFTDWRGKVWNSYAMGANYYEHGSYYLSCVLPSVGNCGGETCLATLKWWER